MQPSKVGLALAGGLLLLAVGGALVLQPHKGEAGDNLWTGSREVVGANRSAEGRTVLPQSQTISPAGKQVELRSMRPQALALSPDGKMLITSGKTNELLAIDPQSGAILQRVTLPSEKNKPDVPVSDHILEPDKNGQLSFTGLIFSPDGSRIYLSNVNGSIKVFGVANGKITPQLSLALPETKLAQRKAEIPAGLTLSGDGKLLYVCANLSNGLLEMDAQNGKVLRRMETGALPYDVLLLNDKAYVSNWGGRVADAKSITGPAGRGSVIRVDSERYIASEGSLSILDLKNGRAQEILTGKHASALAFSPDKKYLVIANAGEDTLSVLDTRSDKIVETVSLREDDLFGSSPNALAFSPDGTRLFVALGTRNCVTQIAFRAGRCRVMGKIPTGWFPGALAYDENRKMLHVANIKGVGSGHPVAAGAPVKYNTHQYFGTLSLIPLPGAEDLAHYTGVVDWNTRRAMTNVAKLEARPNQPPRPIPQRVGEPSVFKHVVYIIKENRTYDQVLGDIKEGNGDPSLCIFGENITPNQHKIAREFALLDNTYCSGILSADGHQWADTAFATDYMERSFAGFPRSYPDGMSDSDVDAMAYSPTGFIWDNVLKHGKKLRDYGEFTIEEAGWSDATRKGKPTFKEYYDDFIKDGKETKISCRPAIESLRPHMKSDTVGWNMRVPDVVRAAKFIEELKAYETKGNFPDFTIICLPNDHTSGTSPGMPTPAAHIADNDLAMGRLMEAISHSKFWKETCVFVIEDDPQNGWDHVSGYRTTAYVVSPYTKRKAVVSTQYNQPALLHTMELILGLPPMNMMDAIATPLYDCFTDTPDFTPYDAVPSNVPLDQLNLAPRALADPVQRRYAEISARLPLHKIDACPDDLLNRILWTNRKGSKAPYPARYVSLVKEE